MTPWTLKDGQLLVAGLQGDAGTFGYHIALGGSVLTKGQSLKDIDLYFLPFGSSALTAPQPKDLMVWLNSLWGDPIPVGGREIPVPPGLDREDFIADALDAQEERLEARQRVAIAPVVGNRLRAAAQAYAAPPAIRRDGLDYERERVPQIERAPYDNNLEAMMDKTPYSYQLRYIRQGGDRIDVYIL